MTITQGRAHALPSLPTDPHVRPRIQLGRGISARDYLLALAECQEHRRAYAAAVPNGFTANGLPTSLEDA